MINLQKIFYRTMVSTKGKELLPHREFPVRRLYCYVPPCAAIIPLHVLNHHRPGEGQRELHALGWPITEYRHHVLPPRPSPIYLGGIFCEGQSTYSPQVELVASSQSDRRPAQDDAPPLSKSKSMAPRPSKYAARRCNT